MCLPAWAKPGKLVTCKLIVSLLFIWVFAHVMVFILFSWFVFWIVTCNGHFGDLDLKCYW